MLSKRSLSPLRGKIVARYNDWLAANPKTSGEQRRMIWPELSREVEGDAAAESTNEAAWAPPKVAAQLASGP